MHIGLLLILLFFSAVFCGVQSMFTLPLILLLTQHTTDCINNHSLLILYITLP